MSKFQEWQVVTWTSTLRQWCFLQFQGPMAKRRPERHPLYMIHAAPPHLDYPSGRVSMTHCTLGQNIQPANIHTIAISCYHTFTQIRAASRPRTHNCLRGTESAKITLSNEPYAASPSLKTLALSVHMLVLEHFQTTITFTYTQANTHTHTHSLSLS